MKKDKYILAVGDSFTDRDFKSVEYPDYDCSYKKWPELLANRLQTDVINLGRCGVDNDYILNSAYDHILDNHEKIELVVVGMTEAWRFTVYNSFLINPIALVRENLSIRKWHDYENAVEPLSKFIMVDQLLSPTDWARNARIMFSHFISHIIRIQKLCKTFGLKLIVTPLLGPISYGALWNIAEEYGINIPYDSRQLAQEFSKTAGFYDVDPATVLGWPFYPHLGGHFLTEGSGGFDFATMKVGPNDGHPNKLGHEHIANRIYNFYGKAYL
jgi:hypothetical protein